MRNIYMLFNDYAHNDVYDDILIMYMMMYSFITYHYYVYDHVQSTWWCIYHYISIYDDIVINLYIYQKMIEHVRTMNLDCEWYLRMYQCLVTRLCMYTRYAEGSSAHRPTLCLNHSWAPTETARGVVFLLECVWVCLDNIPIVAILWRHDHEG